MSETNDKPAISSDDTTVMECVKAFGELGVMLGKTVGTIGVMLAGCAGGVISLWAPFALEEAATRTAAHMLYGGPSTFLSHVPVNDTLALYLVGAATLGTVVALANPKVESPVDSLKRLGVGMMQTAKRVAASTGLVKEGDSPSIKLSESAGKASFVGAAAKATGVTVFTSLTMNCFAAAGLSAIRFFPAFPAVGIGAVAGCLAVGAAGAYTIRKFTNKPVGDTSPESIKKALGGEEATSKYEKDDPSLG